MRFLSTVFASISQLSRVAVDSLMGALARRGRRRMNAMRLYVRSDVRVPISP